MIVSTHLEGDQRAFVFPLARVVCAWAVNPTVRPKTGEAITAVVLEGDREVRTINLPWQAFVRLMD